MKNKFAAFCITVSLLACNRKPAQAPALTNNDIRHVINRMTELMIHDVTNPPLAARFFAYATIAGYEVIAQQNRHFKSMHGILNGYPDLHRPDSIKGYDYKLASLLAMMETAKKMQPSGALLEEYEQHFLDSCSGIGFSDATIQQSARYAMAVSKQVLAYAKADGYNRISNMPRYTPLNKEGNWYPTPPGYLPAVEPYFNTVRPFTLDSCSQFKPPAPVAFSPDKNGPFYQLMHQNYAEALPAEHRLLAAFWDCNPYAVEDNGHMMLSLKKISPAAHWLGITGIVCAQTKQSFDAAMQVHMAVSVALMDAFMCCWDEKYRSNRIRPETAIRKYIDPHWKPLLQTPPFPEYPSGHSVISAAAAVVLSHYIGSKVGFTDNVEVDYGLAPRSFHSFQEAAAEAGISRFYGGIHYMDAITNGRQQGLAVGDWVINKLAAR